MRIVLIDDDPVVRDNMKTLLSIFSPESEIVGEAGGVKEGLACLNNTKTDLVLLDVEMKDGTGFDLLAFYGQPDFKVIFITGHDGYALNAFKYSALDYLLKPVDPTDLQAAIEKVKIQEDSTEQNIKLASHQNNKRGTFYDQTVVLKDTETVYLVRLADIIRCESEGNYTKFYLIDGRKLTITKTLKEYDILFADNSFFRAHQSHLINLHHFDRYEKREGGVVYMVDGSTLPVAVRKKESLMLALEMLR